MKKRTDTAKEKRVELNLHTQMSAMNAVTDVSEAITRAIEWGHSAIAITDDDVVQAFPEAMRAAGDKIKVLYGMTGNFRNDTDISGYSNTQSITILAKNQTGLKNLYKLVSQSNTKDFRRYPIIRGSFLEKHREGLIIGSAGMFGEVFSSVVRCDEPSEQRRFAGFYDFLEIQPLSGINNAYDIDVLREVNSHIVELGRETGIPVCATGNVHFLDPEHEVFRQILLIGDGYDDMQKIIPNHFRTTDEMLEEFLYLGKETAYEVVVTNTRLIADSCETVRPLPPAGKLYLPKIENSAGELKTLVYSRLRELYGDTPPELVSARLETELGCVLEHDYSVIFMAAQKVVAKSLQSGYLVGSRGSVASSIIAYLAGITEVNPLPAHYRCSKCGNSDFEAGTGYGCGADLPDKTCPICGAVYNKDGFNIPFETFLGVEGEKVPDIVLNYSGEFADKAHEHTAEIFDADHVIRAGTIGTISGQLADRLVEEYLNQTGKSATHKEKERLAQGIIGVKRMTGAHTDGLVIIPQDMEIEDFCPVDHPGNCVTGDILITHFEYHFLLDNLLKLDEVGHDDPTMIKMMEDLTGVDARKIRLDDKDTMSIFTSPNPLGLSEDDAIIGDTGCIGIPEFGTEYVRQMLQDVQPQNFDTLIKLSGFTHGTGVWRGNAEDLIKSGAAKIEGTISARDDIMLYLLSKGMDRQSAYEIMEHIREGRGLSDDEREKMKTVGVPDWYIESCEKIQYLFSKAHAAAYVMMAFRIAWFKVHEPLAFYSAYFYRRSQRYVFDESLTHGIDVVRARIQEIKKLRNPSMSDENMLTTLEACYEFYLRGFSFASADPDKADASKFLVSGERELRVPLGVHTTV